MTFIPNVIGALGTVTKILIQGQECCFQDLFKIARSHLVKFQSGFFSLRFVNVHVVHLYSSMDTSQLGRNPVLFYWIDQTSV